MNLNSFNNNKKCHDLILVSTCNFAIELIINNNAAVVLHSMKFVCLLFYGISALRLYNANNDNASPHHGHCLTP